MLIREALAQGSADLKYAGIKTPGLDASILLSFVLNKNRTFVIASEKEKINEKNCAVFCSLIERRANGECVAYLTGKKEFMGLEFTVNKSVLVPRPDTETLVEAAIEYIKKNLPRTYTNQHEQINNRVLDLCTGSGAVAISLKHEMPQLDIYATDICSKALKVAKENAEKLLGKNKISFFKGDLFNALPSISASQRLCENSLPIKFSLIVSNPPYICSSKIQTLSAEVQNEPLLALDGGHDGLDLIRRLIENASKYLAPNGVLLLEADPNQMEEIKTILAKYSFMSIQLYKDLSGSNRVIGGRYEK